MVKFILGLLVGIIVSIGSMAYATDIIKISVNGKEIASDVSPQIINNRTMVPIRVIAEALQANVEWDENTRTVKITTNQQDDNNITDPNQKMVGDIIEFIDVDIIVNTLDTYTRETGTGSIRTAAANITVIPKDGNITNKSRFLDFIGGWEIDNSHEEITSRINAVPDYPTNGKYIIDVEHEIEKGKYVTAIKIKGEGKIITVKR